MLTSPHIRNLLICKLTEVVQHQTAALLFRQFGDCLVQLSTSIRWETVSSTLSWGFAARLFSVAFVTSDCS